MSTTLEFDVRLAGGITERRSITVQGLTGVTEDGQFSADEQNAYKNYLARPDVLGSIPAGASIVNDSFIIVEGSTRSNPVALGGLIRPVGATAAVAPPPSDPTAIRAISNTVGLSYSADGRPILWTRANATDTNWRRVGGGGDSAGGPGSAGPRPDAGAPRPVSPPPVASGSPNPPGGAPRRPTHDGHGGGGNGPGGVSRPAVPPRRPGALAED